MDIVRKTALGAAIVGAALVGGAVGATLIGSAGAQDTPTTSTTVTTGVDHSNQDPTHEASESAQREADETAGKMGGHDGPSNTDPAHEASESPERAAQEKADDAAGTNG